MSFPPGNQSLESQTPTTLAPNNASVAGSTPVAAPSGSESLTAQAPVSLAPSNASVAGSTPVAAPSGSESLSSQAPTSAAPGGIVVGNQPAEEPDPPATPGNVSLSPGNTGLGYTMPALPSGAATLRLEYSANGSSGWSTIASGLAGGATGTDTAGAANTLRYYRAVAVGAGGETAGSATSATTVDVPATADAPHTFQDINADIDVAMEIPALPARAVSFKLQVNINGAGWNDVAGQDPCTPSNPVVYQDAADGIPLQFRLVAANNYGTSNGTAGSHTPNGSISIPAPSHYYKLDEASGTRNDSEGTNHLTGGNGAGSTAGKIGNCATFDSGNPDSLVGAAAATLDHEGGSYSYAGWVRNVAGHLWSCWDESEGGGGSNRCFLLGAGDGDVSLTLTDNTPDDWSANSSGMALAADTWHHVAIVLDRAAGEIKFYKDGSLVSTTISVPALTGGQFALRAGANDGETYLLDGQLDEWAFFKGVALSAGEVSALYNSGSGKTWNGSAWV